MSRRLVGTMSADGLWVAATTMTPAARPRVTRSRTSRMNVSWLFFVADGGGEPGQFVDDDEDEADVVALVDLAAAV